jgi:hypothetical protein
LAGIGSIAFEDEGRYLADRDEPMEFYREQIIPYKSALELWFVENNTPWLYIKMIFVTVWVNVKASNPIFSELLRPSGSEPQDVREMAVFFASMQRQERLKGGPVSCRSADTHKLIRYQRNGIARLSKAVRQGYIKKVTKRSQTQLQIMACDKYPYQ